MDARDPVKSMAVVVLKYAFLQEACCHSVEGPAQVDASADGGTAGDVAHECGGCQKPPTGREGDRGALDEKNVLASHEQVVRGNSRGQSSARMLAKGHTEMDDGIPVEDHEHMEGSSTPGEGGALGGDSVEEHGQAPSAREVD